MSDRLYIISGESGSGKTILLNLIQNKTTFKAVVTPKYSTRPERKGEFDDIKRVTRVLQYNKGYERMQEDVSIVLFK